MRRTRAKIFFDFLGDLWKSAKLHENPEVGPLFDEKGNLAQQFRGPKDAFLHPEPAGQTPCPEVNRLRKMGLGLRLLTVAYLEGKLSVNPSTSRAAALRDPEEPGLSMRGHQELHAYLEAQKSPSTHADIHLLTTLAELLNFNLIILNPTKHINDDKAICVDSPSQELSKQRPNIVIQHNGKSGSLGHYNFIQIHPDDMRHDVIEVPGDGSCGFYCFAVALRMLYQHYEDTNTSAPSRPEREAKVEVDEKTSTIPGPQIRVDSTSPRAASIRPEASIKPEASINNKAEIIRHQKALLEACASLSNTRLRPPTTTASEEPRYRKVERTPGQIEQDYNLALRIASEELLASKNPYTLLPRKPNDSPGTEALSSSPPISPS